MHSITDNQNTVSAAYNASGVSSWICDAAIKYLHCCVTGLKALNDMKF